MDKKVIVALAVLFIVVVAGAILIALPVPTGNGNSLPAPFTSKNVRLDVLGPGGTVLPNFTITGEARGTWYFEADFPVEVRDPDGHVVGRGIAQAQGEWMTTNFVPFSAPIVVENYSGPATLILHKDNPSGLPEHDDSVSFPITVQ
jgi:hypothetical protein